MNREDAGFDMPIAVSIFSAIKMPGSYLKVLGVRGFRQAKLLEIRHAFALDFAKSQSSSIVVQSKARL